MRVLIAHTDRESHPDVPDQQSVPGLSYPICVIYLDGQVHERTTSLAQARLTFRAAVNSRKWEYVDLRIEEDRRQVER